jgi:predicted nucleic acid-binding protein
VALVVDTGPLYAAIDRHDQAHAKCAALLRSCTEPIIVPAPVVVELDWLVASRLTADAFDAFLDSVTEGAVLVEALAPSDYARVRRLCQRYADLPLGFVDAAVVAIVERLGERKLATLDRRHFRVVRPAHVRSLELLPAS